MHVSRFQGFISVAMIMAGPMVLASAPAAAHWGHLVDLGGHAHWAGLALGAAAAALAAGLAAARPAKDEDEDTALSTEDQQGEPRDA